MEEVGFANNETSGNEMMRQQDGKINAVKQDPCSDKESGYPTEPTRHYDSQQTIRLKRPQGWAPGPVSSPSTSVHASG